MEKHSFDKVYQFHDTAGKGKKQEKEADGMAVRLFTSIYST